MAPRTMCSLMVEFKGGAQPWRRAMLADLSTTGFRLTGIRQLEDFGSLWMRPCGMDPLAAKIRWASDHAVGCEFLYPLDVVTEAALRELVARERVEIPVRVMA
ncbi:PilZ domain-containing protein [Tsuneonella sp. HG222]